jgi:hypothetical protein
VNASATGACSAACIPITQLMLPSGARHVLRSRLVDELQNALPCPSASCLRGGRHTSAFCPGATRCPTRHAGNRLLRWLCVMDMRLSRWLGWRVLMLLCGG